MLTGLLKNTYHRIYLGFLFSVILVFFITRPLNSDYHKFIAGDGFGYYAYLPAKFIHNDPHYDFKWFNRVHNNNYMYSAFEDPLDNFMVPYGHKKINKYYQGLSLLWTPFFIGSHLVAKIGHYTPDGFSKPYQLGIGIASLCYLLLGLFYLRKLLYEMFKNEIIAVLIPVFIFYGTRLFYFGINMNSESHVYSFTFITLFIYSSYLFFTRSQSQLKYLLLSVLFLTIVVCIRPINLLCVIIPFAFFQKNKIQLKTLFKGFGLIHLSILLITLAFLINQFQIAYIQTGTLFPYTYTDEKFYFSSPHLNDVLISYRSGWFIYVPVALISLIGLLFLKNTLQKIILLSFMFLMLYLFSSWWFWPIVSRVMIDFHAVLAIGLAALGIKLFQNQKLKILFLTLCILSTGYYQLKSMQLHNGILAENYTYKEIFWRNFFRTHKGNMFLVPPESILKQVNYAEDFEDSSISETHLSSTSHDGKRALKLNQKNPFTPPLEYQWPLIFNEPGIKKVRLSFWSKFSADLPSADVYLKFLDKDKQLVFETVFYINEAHIQKEVWDYKEFGYQIAEEDLKGKKPVFYVSWFIWNTHKKGQVTIDEMKTDFLLTNKDFEVFK